MKLKSIEEVQKEVLALEHEIDDEDNWISTDEDIANIVKFVIKQRDQHIIQTIRKEMEGKNNEVNGTECWLHVETALDDIRTFLTTLEERSKACKP